MSRVVLSGILLVVLVAAPRSAFSQDRRSPEISAEFHRAESAWKSGGSMLEAKARLDKVISAVPQDGDALKLRAKVQLAMSRVDEALADARKAVELLPEDGEAHLILCEAARLAGQLEVALQAMENAARFINSDALTHIRLSREAMLLGRYEEAESLARVAVALEPRSVEGRYQLARSLALRGKVEMAAAVLVKGLEESLLEAGAIADDPILDSTGVSGQVLNRK